MMISSVAGIVKSVLNQSSAVSVSVYILLDALETVESALKTMTLELQVASSIHHSLITLTKTLLNIHEILL